MENPKNNTFILETIKVMRPTTSNKIFNAEAYTVIETNDENGEKLVLLQEKENKL